MGIIVAFFLCSSLFYPQSIFAIADCSSVPITTDFSKGPFQSSEINQLSVKVNTQGFAPGEYQVVVFIGAANRVGESQKLTVTTTPSGTAMEEFIVKSTSGNGAFEGQTWRQRRVELHYNNTANCTIGTYKITSDQVYCGPSATVTITQERTINGKPATCYIAAGACVEKKPYTIVVTGLEKNDQPFTGSLFDLQSGWENVVNGKLQMTRQSDYFVGYQLAMGAFGTVKVEGSCASYLPGTIPIETCPTTSCSTTQPPTNVIPSEVNFELCKQVNSSTLEQECLDCFNINGVWTAVGCISREPEKMIEAVVKIGVGMGGGIALLVTLVGGFLITTSQGDPKRTQQGKEMITAAVIGILFVLFSVVILQFIGVTIFRLPGFGT